MRGRRKGFTLIELLVALGMMVIVGTTVAGLLIVSLKSIQGVPKGLDVTQQLRVALKQINDDVSMAQRDPEMNPSSLCHPAIQAKPYNGCEFRLMAYQPVIEDGTQWNDWPGNLSSVDDFWIMYSIQDQDLVREIWSFDMTQLVSRRVILSGLAQYRPGSTSGSQFTPIGDLGTQIQADLRMKEGDAVASTILYMRFINRL